MKNAKQLLEALHDAVYRNNSEDVCNLLSRQKISLEIQVVAASLNIVGLYLQYQQANDGLKKYHQEMIIDFGQLVFANAHTLDSVPESCDHDVLFEYLQNTISGPIMSKLLNLQNIEKDRKIFDRFVKFFIDHTVLFMFAKRKMKVFFAETAKNTEPLKIFDSLLEIRNKPGRVRKPLQAPAMQTQDDEENKSDSESSSSASNELPPAKIQTPKPVDRQFINELKQPLLRVLQNEMTRIRSSKHWLYKEVDTNRKLQALSNFKNQVEQYNSTDIPAFKTYVKDLSNAQKHPDLYLKRRSIFSLSSSAPQSSDTNSYHEVSKAIYMLVRS